MKTEKLKGLPLYPGSRPCVQCGYCCKVRSCGCAEYDINKGQCSALVDNGDGTYGCGIFKEITDKPISQWEMCPAFGAGCCCVFNSDRKKLIEKESRTSV